MKKHLSILVFFALSNNSIGQFNPLIFNFDTIESVYIDTSLTGNIWQIGIPQKSFFNSALNGQHAILTDTINFYPNNNLSEFIIKTPTYVPNWGGVHFDFSYKIDTDTMIDGGTIEVSYDGINWVNILSSQGLLYNILSFSSNDTVSSLHEPGFSGQSTNWTRVQCYWNYPNTDTISIKFKFASDGINNNREGWMIDSILFYYDLGIGISENRLISDNIFFYPNPSNNNSILYFRNAYNESIQLSLFNPFGKLVYALNNITSNHVNIDCENLSNGLYLFSLQTSNKIIASGKLIISK